MPGLGECRLAFVRDGSKHDDDDDDHRQRSRAALL